MTPLNQRLARRGRLVVPLLAAVLVSVLLGAAVLIPTITASARSDSTAADDTVFGLPATATSATAPGPSSCVTSAPLTPRQLRQLAHRPVTHTHTPSVQQR